jgi:beta-lactamase superfamily II metal-dependent hydrolase
MARKATRKTSPARKTGPAAPEAVIRMYRVGFGDCFLLTLPRQDAAPFRMLIDCGVAQRTANEAALMQEILRDVIAETASELDVLVVTHEHYDHVSGLLAAADLFLRPGEAADPKRLRVRETWFAWTEDPNDPDARRIGLTRREKVQRLSRLAASLGRDQGAHAQALAAQVGGLIGFFGAAPGEDGKTHLALENARSFGERVSYHRPGEPPITPEGVPGVRIWVLGPPFDEAALRVRDNPRETYRLAAEADQGHAFFLAGALGTGARLDGDPQDDPYAPFDPAYAMALDPGPEGLAAGARAMTAGMKEFLERHYSGAAEDKTSPDQSWRRIDTDWLGAAAELALDLDNRTNNTSLVLAIELVRGGPVLLFAADAQVGNWRSWKDAAWTLPDGETMHGPDLLRRAAFYKVGHHGSQNATLKAEGLELMPDNLVAFIPVDHDAAVSLSWGDKFPLPGLEQALAGKTAGRVVRNDRPFPEALGGEAAAGAFRRRRTPLKDPKADAGALYYEWRMPMPR